MCRYVTAVCLLAVAGCGPPAGAPADGLAAAETVTPAPVPSPSPSPSASASVDRPVGVDGPGIDDGVGGAALGAAHASALSGTYTRVVTLRVEADDRALPTYRESRAATDDATTQRRSYRGPVTARFVSGNATATTARTVRSVDGNGTRRRTFVDGDPAPGTQVTAPVAADDRTVVASLLDGAIVASRTESPDYRLSAGAVPGEAVPDPLAAPEGVTVRAAVRRTDGSTGVSSSTTRGWAAGGYPLHSGSSGSGAVTRSRPRGVTVDGSPGVARTRHGDRGVARPSPVGPSTSAGGMTIHGADIHARTRSTTDRSSGR